MFCRSGEGVVLDIVFRRGDFVPEGCLGGFCPFPVFTNYCPPLTPRCPLGHDCVLAVCSSNLHQQSFIVRCLFDFM